MIAICDLRYRVIPKGLNFLGISLLLACTSRERFIYALTASFCTYILYALMFRVSRAEIGYGDVRLAPLAADYSWGNPLPIHLLAWALAGIFSLLRGKMGMRFPFAPFLLAATVIVNQY